MSACNPLDIVTEIILESLCTADISSFTRHRHIAPQQNITTVGDERLSWPALGVSGEVVSEEPGTSLRDSRSRFDSNNCSATTPVA